MKKFFSLILCFVILSALVIPCSAAEAKLNAFVVETIYPTDDVVIANIDITKVPYNADNTGKEDVTKIIQQAIDDCFNIGGGTVWLPKGEYRVTGNIYIQKFVTLRGEYQDPDDGNDYGTVIVADVESSSEILPALFTISGSAGAVGLTVWYPEQSIERVIPYPYTFYIETGHMLQTIQNCTLINSYRGIGAGAQYEFGVSEPHEMMTIENVKGTCLYEGISVHNSSDVDTIKTLYISNTYWAQSGEKFNAPSMEKLNEYTRANSYGMVLGDLEWPNIADVKISNMIYGIHFKKGCRYTFSGSFADLYITDCDYGIYIPEDAMYRRGETWGLGIVNGVVEGSKYAILHEDYSAIQLTNVRVEGEIKADPDAVEIMQYTTDTTSFSPDYNTTYKKPVSVLYTVNTDTTGKTDVASDIQKALDKAEETGGVVYLPAGVYRLENPVTVPEGVELRGSSSVPVRCQSGCSNGTLLISYYGYNENDKPLITLDGDNAGLNGLRIDYPLNNPVDDSGDYKKTSPAVYSKSDGVYVTNCTITLAATGVVLEDCENAFIKKLIGCCIEGMFNLKNCKNSTIEGCHQNANALPRNGYSNYDIPEFKNRVKEDNNFEFFFIPIGRKQTTYITLDACENISVFNTFIYGGKSFLNAKDTTATFVNVGNDGSSKTEPALQLSGGSINFLNFMRSTEDGSNGQHYYEVENGTKFRSYNSQAVGMCFKENVILENIDEDNLLTGEEDYNKKSDFNNFIRPVLEVYMVINQNDILSAVSIAAAALIIIAVFAIIAIKKNIKVKKSDVICFLAGLVFVIVGLYYFHMQYLCYEYTPLQFILGFVVCLGGALLSLPISKGSDKKKKALKAVAVALVFALSLVGLMLLINVVIGSGNLEMSALIIPVCVTFLIAGVMALLCVFRMFSDKTFKTVLSVLIGLGIAIAGFIYIG